MATVRDLRSLCGGIISGVSKAVLALRDLDEPTRRKNITKLFVIKQLLDEMNEVELTEAPNKPNQTPQQMAPSVNGKGERNYSNPNASSHAARKGFVG